MRVPPSPLSRGRRCSLCLSPYPAAPAPLSAQPAQRPARRPGTRPSPVCLCPEAPSLPSASWRLRVPPTEWPASPPLFSFPALRAGLAARPVSPRETICVAHDPGHTGFQLVGLCGRFFLTPWPAFVTQDGHMPGTHTPERTRGLHLGLSARHLAGRSLQLGQTAHPGRAGFQAGEGGGGRRGHFPLDAERPRSVRAWAPTC